VDLYGFQRWKFTFLGQAGDSAEAGGRQSFRVGRCSGFPQRACLASPLFSRRRAPGMVGARAIWRFLHRSPPLRAAILVFTCTQGRLGCRRGGSFKRRPAKTPRDFANRSRALHSAGPVPSKRGLEDRCKHRPVTGEGRTAEIRENAAPGTSSDCRLVFGADVVIEFIERLFVPCRVQKANTSRSGRTPATGRRDRCSVSLPTNRAVDNTQYRGSARV